METSTHTTVQKYAIAVLLAAIGPLSFWLMWAAPLNGDEVTYAHAAKGIALEFRSLLGLKGGSNVDL